MKWLSFDNAQLQGQSGFPCPILQDGALAEHGGFQAFAFVVHPKMVNPLYKTVHQVPGRATAIALALLKEPNHGFPLILVTRGLGVAQDIVKKAVHHEGVANLLGEKPGLFLELGEVIL